MSDLPTAAGLFEREPGCTCEEDDMDPQMLLEDPDCSVHGIEWARRMEGRQR